MEPTESVQTRTTETLDCSGLLCPLPVYKASQALRRLAPGQVLELICTDPGSLEDIPALARQTGHRLLEMRDDGTIQPFWLERTAS